MIVGQDQQSTNKKTNYRPCQMIVGQDQQSTNKEKYGYTPPVTAIRATTIRPNQIVANKANNRATN
jgi:hypothetical protein